MRRSIIISATFLAMACSASKETGPVVEIRMAASADSIGPATLASVPAEGATGPIVELEEQDINGDGRSDVTHVYERGELGTVLVRREVDLNWDGRVDVRSWLSPDGALSREEMDGDFDGWVDWVDHYQAGVRVRSEIDTDYDHSLDLVLYFEQGDQIVRRIRDVDGDRQMERIESGSCVKIDENRDGIYELTSGTGCPEDPI